MQYKKKETVPVQIHIHTQISNVFHKKYHNWCNRALAESLIQCSCEHETELNYARFSLYIIIRKSKHQGRVHVVIKFGCDKKMQM